jgi:hypothetical protein
MTRWILAATAILGLGATSAFADDIRDAREDVRDEWRDYQKALRDGDPDDIQDEWRDYCEARQDLNRAYYNGANTFRNGYHGNGYYVPQNHYPQTYGQPYYGNRFYGGHYYGRPYRTGAMRVRVWR